MHTEGGGLGGAWAAWYMGSEGVAALDMLALAWPCCAALKRGLSVDGEDEGGTKETRLLHRGYVKGDALQGDSKQHVENGEVYGLQWCCSSTVRLIKLKHMSKHRRKQGSAEDHLGLASIPMLQSCTITSDRYCACAMALGPAGPAGPAGVMGAEQLRSQPACAEPGSYADAEPHWRHVSQRLALAGTKSGRSRRRVK